MQRNSSNWESLGNWYPYFPQNMGTFFHQIPILWYILTRGKYMALPINFPSHQFQMLELKAKYIKRRRGHGCYFIKKEEYKYTLGNSIPPFTKLSLFLTINSKNYNSYPKISTKIAVIVEFGRSVSKGYSFEKDSQFNLYFSIAMWCCGCSTSQTFVFHSLVLSYWIHWHCDIKLLLLLMIKLDSSTSTREKKSFQFFLFRECVNLGYIHWTKAQTFSLPILDYLLVYAY